MMTLDDAIKHAEEVARENEKFCYKKGGKGGYFNEDTDWNNIKCVEEHRQLADWLKDYKRLLEQEPCEDCWSKKEVVDIINRQRFGINKISMGIIKEKLEALPSVTPIRIETVTEFADRCRECGNEHGKQLKQLEHIKERYAEERQILLNSNSEYTPNNVLDIIDYIIHGD